MPQRAIIRERHSKNRPRRAVLHSATMASKTGSQLERRAADDAQTSLVAVWYSTIPAAPLARLLGLEQPRVLDGDDGLVGEGLHQLHVIRGSKNDRLTIFRVKTLDKADGPGPSAAQTTCCENRANGRCRRLFEVATSVSQRCTILPSSERTEGIKVGFGEKE